MNILSIQSWVAYGHVGNAAAMFPLQRLGAEVWAIHTVQFSNHPGHGGFTGEVFPPERVAALVEGVAARGVLARCDAVLSGYIGDAGTGAAILEAARRVRAENPAALWACDPVIGDDGAPYVRPGVADFFRERAVPEADLLTPNLWELAWLTGLPCGSRAEARAAMLALRRRMRAAGPRAVLVTSFTGSDTPDGWLDVLAAGPDGTFILSVPLLPCKLHGAGDAIAGLYLYHMLRTGRAAVAAGRAASAIAGLLRISLARNETELALVAAQEEFVSPSTNFVAMPF